MIDAEKIIAYDRMMVVIRDAIALEQNCVRKHDPASVIEFNRAEAFRRIVETVSSVDALPWRLRIPEESG